MLILDRRREERVHIGPDITITVVRIGTNQVSLGIDAPKHVQVLRDDAKRTAVPDASAKSETPTPRMSRV